MYLIILLYAVFAGTFSLGKVILAYTQPIFAIGTRMAIAGSLILGYHFFISKKEIYFRWDHWSLYLKMILFTVFIPYTLRGWALGHVPACKASFLYNCGPFISYVLACILYSEQWRFKKLMGLIIGFVGLLPVLLTQEVSFFNSIIPSLAIIFSVSFSSYGWLMAYDIIKKYPYEPMFLNGIGMLGGGILALLLSLCVETQGVYVKQWLPFLTIMGTIIVVSNLICHNLYANLLRFYTPTMLSFGGFCTPFFAGIYGWLFLNEQITWLFFGANGIVFVGLLLFYYEELKEHKENILFKNIEKNHCTHQDKTT